MKKLILVACIAVIAILSCKKENTSSTDICTTAMVHYGGDPNVDGLGWILVTDTATWQYQSPENLDASFKIEGLMVDICYYKTERDFICLCPPPVKKIIHLTSIKVH